jgi:NADPH-dependent curcumin reductase CurA
MPANRQIRLAARPQGVPEESDFDIVQAETPEPGDGQVLVHTNYLTVDPYMRGVVSGAAKYMDPVGPGDVMLGEAVGTVVESHHPDLDQGDAVLGNWGWQEYAACDGDDLEKIDRSLAPISTALGVLGMPGMTAYFGLLEIGRPEEGETVFVSGAAGAVGSLVGQIAKIKGCRAAGSAGSQEKIDWLLDELGFDAAFNYREHQNYTRPIRRACPKGVDVYYDNVGGPVTDAVFRQINDGARIVVCGQISQYNATESPEGPRLLWYLTVRQARAEGFLVMKFRDRYPEGRAQMAQWIREGRIKYRETIVDGLENTPKAFIGLFSGQNIGKMLVRVAPES